jgi:cytochrome b561
MQLPIRNTTTQYGFGGRILHWSSVALLLVLIFTSLEFEDLEAGSERVELIRKHASYGLIFLFIMLSRLTWRCKNINPVRSYSIKSWQKFSAFFLHRLIYAVIITQCVAGLLSLSFAGSGIPFFDLFELPALLDKHDEFYSLSASIHFVLSIVIYPLFAIHISAAIYHQIFGVLDD